VDLDQADISREELNAVCQQTAVTHSKVGGLILPLLNATNSLRASSNQEQGTFMNIKTHSCLSASRRGLKALGSLIALLMLTAGAATGVVPTPKEIRGPFPIMSTVYFEDGSVDYDGLDGWTIRAVRASSGVSQTTPSTC
jgi:hypothetical protein